MESDNAAAMADWALEWNGMIEINITPLMEDETIGGVIEIRSAKSRIK